MFQIFMRHYVYMEFAIALFDGSVIVWLTIPDDKPDTLPEMAKPCKFITSLINHFLLWQLKCFQNVISVSGGNNLTIIVDISFSCHCTVNKFIQLDILIPPFF